MHKSHKAVWRIDRLSPSAQMCTGKSGQAPRNEPVIEALFKSPLIIFGCGNTLFGDDGFGPEVIEWLLSHYELPESVLAVDVGTSISDYLFDLAISSRKPTHIFIVDAMSQPRRRPGELFEVDLGDLPATKASDFCLHQFPSVNLLREMHELAGVEVHVLAVQIKSIPEAVQPGLSPEVRQAIPEACEWLMERIAGLHQD